METHQRCSQTMSLRPARTRADAAEPLRPLCSCRWRPPLPKGPSLGEPGPFSSAPLPSCTCCSSAECSLHIHTEVRQFIQGPSISEQTKWLPLKCSAQAELVLPPPLSLIPLPGTFPLCYTFSGRLWYLLINSLWLNNFTVNCLRTLWMAPLLACGGWL